jgi:hypothetical protein
VAVRRSFTTVFGSATGFKAGIRLSQREPRESRRSYYIAILEDPNAGINVADFAATEAADTLVSAGATVIDGALAKTEGADTLVTVAGPIASAAVARTEAADTLAAAAGPVVAAALSASEAGDTVAAVAALIVSGQLAANDASDTLDAAGSVQAAGDITADLAVTEADDSLAAVATNGDQSFAGGYARPRLRLAPEPIESRLWIVEDDDTCAARAVVNWSEDDELAATLLMAA